MSDVQSYKPIQVGKFTFSVPETDIADRKRLQLSVRELEVLSNLARGLRSVEVAGVMGLKPSTVDTFKRRIFKKLGVTCVGGAVALYYAWEFSADLKLVTQD